MLPFSVGSTTDEHLTENKAITDHLEMEEKSGGKGMENEQVNVIVVIVLLYEC